MLYLKPNIVAEPLVNHWYGSMRCISPAMAAMVMVKSFQKIMSSYVNSPQMHEMASKHPSTKGGPFINYSVRKVDEIRALIAQTEEKCNVFFNFARDIQKLQDMLNTHQKGMSLEPIYPDIPESLKGYVELYYDVVNQPHFRLIEALLYESELNTSRLQTCVLSEIHQDERPFILSTPRFAGPNDVEIALPFVSRVYDDLFRSKEQGLDDSAMKSMIQNLQIKANDEATFLSLFQQEKMHNKYQPLCKDEPVRIRYFGHACVLIETHDLSILFDPVISYDYPSAIEKFTYADLPESIDYIVLSHAHQDHVLIEHLLQLRHKTRTIIVPNNVPGAIQDPALKLMLKHLGFQNVIALDEFEKVFFKEGFIQGLPFFGEHSDLHIQSKLAFLVQVSGIKIICAVDSNNLENRLYEKVHAMTGDIDILFLGMECVGAPLSWLYGPVMLTEISREMDQSRRLDGSNFEKAKQIVDILHCKQIYVYAMGQEPWLDYVMGIDYTEDSPAIIESNQLLAYCQSKNIVAERLFGRKEIYFGHDN